MDRREQRELRQGAGDALAASFEMIATPGVFAFLGWLLDRWLGTLPVFTLVLGLTVLAYMVWKVYVQYAADMDSELEARRRSRAGGPADA